MPFCQPASRAQLCVSSGADLSSFRQNIFQNVKASSNLFINKYELQNQQLVFLEAAVNTKKTNWSVESGQRGLFGERCSVF